MKRIVFLIPLVLTGCFGGAAVGNLKTTCVKKDYSSSIIETKEYTIYYSKGNVDKVVINDTFDTSIDMSNAIKSYKKAYENEVGVTVYTKDNSITYEFELKNIKDEIKKDFNLSNKYNDQVKKLKESGAVCD